MDKRNVYPEYSSRMNYFANKYCEMAMESYFNAMQCFKIISEDKYDISKMNQQSKMEKYIISTIVFSSMTIEAFINDYAATCLGDSEFYNNFDKLSVLSKLELISIFILKTNLDRSQACYSQIKKLFNERNNYVHAKSKKFVFNGCSSEENNDDWLARNIDCGTFQLDKDEIKKDMSSALNAISAIKSLALFFDNNDDNINAINRLFSPNMTQYFEDEKNEYTSYVLKVLKIKYDNYKHKLTCR